jgi:molybdopterin molybdotransferase
MSGQYISYNTAIETTIEHIRALPVIERLISNCEGYITADSVVSLVDSPSVNTSMKDGYALRAADMAPAQEDTRIRFQISGSVAAGADKISPLEPGTALRILTGAPLPPGADTIVAEEFTDQSDGCISVTRTTEKGRNILIKGSDIASGDVLLDAGVRLTPGRIGLLAAGGHSSVRVFPKPHVAIIATGDEVLLPGQSLTAGKLYASNLLTLNGWCRRFGFQTTIDVVGDDAGSLAERIRKAARQEDAIVTSGGAWTGDKDMMARVLNQLGWRKKFHRVRLGPGKAVGFGLLDEKPVFILPGGPPSNLVAFLVLALPGLMRLSGYPEPGLPSLPAKLAEPVAGQIDWTQAIFGSLQSENETATFHPHRRTGSRLKSMARAQGLLLIPEGTAEIRANETVQIRRLT